MKHRSTLLHRLIPIVLAGLLAACATPGKGDPGMDAEHEAHHPKATTSAAPSDASSGGQMGQMGQMGMMDMKTMCDMHRNMMSAKSPAEREAMMNPQMRSMSPEMQRQHMEMMAQMCK